MSRRCRSFGCTNLTEAGSISSVCESCREEERRYREECAELQLRWHDITEGEEVRSE